MLPRSEQIQQWVEQWARGRDFTAPYGVLTGTHTNPRGRRYRSVTFGRARSLDVAVQIYNANWIVVRSSAHPQQVFGFGPEFEAFLNSL